MIKVYLAGPCSTEERTLMVQVATVLRENDFDVYCPWELKIENAWDIPQEEWAREVFKADIAAINECDIFVMISYGRMSTAGTNWENGYAFALNKKIVIFQIIDVPTSLMTFSSASNFFNCSRENLIEKVKYAIRCIEININGTMYQDNNINCKTVLT